MKRSTHLVQEKGERGEVYMGGSTVSDGGDGDSEGEDVSSATPERGCVFHQCGLLGRSS